jgi:hypothetical protein
MANNDYGIVFFWASNNIIYHNNFVNNSRQVYDVANEPPYIWPFSINVWDYGYPSGGNYWSDYNGSDLYYGPSQNITGSDGIGDKPNVIYENNVDRYPLIRAWASLIGDVNGDGTVDMADISMAVDAFMSYLGHPRWNPYADIDGDNLIDLLDIMLIIENFTI